MLNPNTCLASSGLDEHNKPLLLYTFARDHRHNRRRRALIGGVGLGHNSTNSAPTARHCRPSKNLQQPRAVSADATRRPFSGPHQRPPTTHHQLSLDAPLRALNHQPPPRRRKGSCRGPQPPTAAATAYADTTSFLTMRSYTSRTFRPTMVWNRPVPLLEPGKPLFFSICWVISP